MSTEVQATCTNAQSGTTIAEIEEGIFRISTPLPPEVLPGGFSFNQFLILDEVPLLFHTGPRRLFPLVKEAIETLMPIDRLRYVAFSHVEADECGSMNEFLAAAPAAVPLCGTVAALVSMNDLADRLPRPMQDEELLTLGKRTVQWHDAPHLPHAWECGFLSERSTRTLFCGDLFTQGGATNPPLTDGDILGPSENFRHQMDYYSHTPHADELLGKLAATAPRTLACMHGSSWRGDGGALLRELGACLAQSVSGR